MAEERKPLDGKVAIVIGAGKNIGRGIALALARDGASVVVNGRSDQDAVNGVVGEIEAAGGSAIPMLADVSREEDVTRLVSDTVARFGGVDIAVSNAGLRRQTPLVEMSFAEWREILSVALDGAFLLARACVPHMIERGGGAFIGMSGVSHHVGTAKRVHVNASKAGLEGLVRGLARELAPHNITVNAVAPGAIDTVRGASSGVRPSAGSLAGIPLSRLGEVSEIAETVRFLVGPHGGYITGQTIHVNGGMFLSK